MPFPQRIEDGNQIQTRPFSGHGDHLSALFFEALLAIVRRAWRAHDYCRLQRCDTKRSGCRRSSQTAVQYDPQQRPLLSNMAAIGKLRIVGEHRSHSHENRIQLQAQALGELPPLLGSYPTSVSGHRGDPAVQGHARLAYDQRAAGGDVAREGFVETHGFLL